MGSREDEAMRNAGMNGFKSPLGESNFGRYNDLCSPSGPDAALTRRDFFLASCDAYSLRTVLGCILSLVSRWAVNSGV